MSMNREPRRGRGGGRGGQGRGGTRGGARGEARGGARGGARGWQNQRGNGGRLPEGNKREDQQVRNIRNNRGRGDRRRERDYNGQQHGQNAERRIHPIGYKRLEELTTLEPHETLHRLAAYKMGLEALLKESEIRFDLMIQLTSALANACIYYQSAVENEEYKRDHEIGRNLVKDEQDASPEDDFHDLPIFPLAEELKEGHRPFLRKNIVNKGYDDVNHYLDIQFRLLKEDFVAPLRKGISEYRRYLQKKEDQKHIRLQDVYVYHKVQVLEAKPFDEGIVYMARFSTEHLTRINWERSRRLLFGSLVCLSSDNFETVHFAIVANRKIEGLQGGLIDLKFHGAIETLPTLFSETFTMAESSAYFEAYRHVLKRIQEIREDSFPLEKYIVRVDPNLELPSYLRRNPFAIYDLKPVAQKGKVIKSLISHARSWPPEKDFDLDSSQFEAFKAALTEELCIIQGPPGTGKTFIGLKIVETLLRNREVWSPIGDLAPILLICYTNHALDQFLEGILEFLPEGVVRIGGRSSSEKIKTLNLKELRRTRSQQKQRPKHQYLQMKNIRGEMLRLAKEMQVAQKSVRTTSSMILKENKLRDVIPHEQFRSLLTGFLTDEAPNLKTGEYIAYWLGAIVGEHDTENAFSEDEDERNLNIHRIWPRHLR
ncbi:hypothetical protein BSL78_00040 [Apostichopus japonicus]|uniref:Uncharacterized protein n=1 Tax=Stichopus japonicus TaxID=307972 RepID=A0A2G8LRZ6_STIJA|nr:hypothetical protein BSL78_00040 [Apostichopus japonicus]